MDVCLIVPSGVDDVGELATAIRSQHDDARIVAVWGGDPHRRPPLDVRWRDLGLDEPAGVGWGRLIAALEPRAYEWARTSRTVADMLHTGSPSVLVLRAGSVGVVGPLDAWAPASGIAALERAPEPLPADGLAPTPAELARRGRWSTAVLGIAADAVGTLDAIADAASTTEPGDSIGPVLQSALAGGVSVSTPPDGLAAGWRRAAGPVAVVDVDDIDPASPWCVDFAGARPRVLFSDDADQARAVAAATPQMGARGDGRVRLPGGIAVDLPIRTLMSAAIGAWRRDGSALPPDPYADADELVAWLLAPSVRTGGAIGRYWFEEWASRPDLHYVFPDPAGADRERFQRWAHDSWRSDGRSPLLRAEDARNTGAVAQWTDVDRRPGINVVGYVAADSGLGDFTRRVHRSLTAADVAVSALHYARTASPRASDTPSLTTDVEHDVNLITVHGDQMRFFADDHGAEVFTARTNIGYWFWELSEVTPHLVEAVDLVDEVWVATEFVADAYRRVTDKPVRVVPVPVPEPARSEATRADLGLPDERFVFLVTLDHLSITDRKNPIGAIRAFERAFPSPTADGPVLVVKTLNASQRWSEHEELQVAAAARPDITVVDRHVERADQMRLIELSDALVSLHRSEGLGLHLLEAMWLGTPVIATRYSGNLDAMSDDNSVLVDAELVPVRDAQGYYPTTALWAEPDLDQAAAAMRVLVADPERASRIADNARRDMMNQPSLTHTGHLIARLCRDASREGQQ